MNSLKEILYQTIHRSRATVPELADILGVSPNYLYKMGLPTDNGARFPLELLLPLMRATGNYAVLRHLADRSGFLLVKIPRVPRNRQETNQMIAGYQALTTEAIRLLIGYFQEPTREKKRNLLEILNKVAAGSIGIKKRVEQGNQLELL